MPFKKGDKKPINSGIKKGTKRFKTVQWELFSEWFMSKGMDRLQEEMNKLEGKDFIMTCKDLMEYFQPKLARTENNVNVQAEFSLLQVHDRQGDT